MTVAAANAVTQAHIAGLRTHLISRLTGLSIPRLRYWHRSGLLEATLRGGRRGTPRLYSWVDYVRLQLASGLDAQDVPARRIRQAIDFLDEYFEEWWLLTDPLSADSRRHVLAEVVPGATPLLADAAGQHAMIWQEAPPAFAEATQHALADIASGGSLCKLSNFRDSVFMSPQVNLAQPSVCGTALETRFVSRMALDMGTAAVAETFVLDRHQIDRAIEFEEAVA